MITEVSPHQNKANLVRTTHAPRGLRHHVEARLADLATARLTGAIAAILKASKGRAYFTYRLRGLIANGIYHFVIFAFLRLLCRIAGVSLRGIFFEAGQPVPHHRHPLFQMLLYCFIRHSRYTRYAAVSMR